MSGEVETVRKYAHDEYDTAKLREMLTMAFDDSELKDFTFDHFGEIYEQFADGMTKAIKISLLIEGCYRRRKLNYLLELLAKYRPEYDWSSSIWPKGNTYDYGRQYFIEQTIVVHIPDIDLHKLSAEQVRSLLLGFKVTLATTLNIPVDNIKIVGMQVGSVILKVNLSSEMGLFPRERNFEELGIQKVEYNRPTDVSWLASIKEAVLNKVVLKWPGSIDLDDGIVFSNDYYGRADGSDIEMRRVLMNALNGVDLRHSDLSGANLSGADLSGADLSEADLLEADLGKANLSGAYLSRVNLIGTYLREANLRGADLKGADLSSIREGIYPSAQASWRQHMRRLNHLDNVDLRGADLREVDLTGANLTGADLTGANLTGANLSGADLTEADLTGTELSKADLIRAGLSESDLPGAIIKDS